MGNFFSDFFKVLDEFVGFDDEENELQGENFINEQDLDYYEDKNYVNQAEVINVLEVSEFSQNQETIQEAKAVDNELNTQEIANKIKDEKTKTPAIARINLKGKALIKDLVAEVKEQIEHNQEFEKDDFANSITSRFLKTIQATITGIEGKFLGNEDKDTNLQDLVGEMGFLSEKEKEQIQAKIFLASEKLYEEIAKEKSNYYLYPSLNSLAKESQQRSIFNVVGRVYDCINHVCHNVAKIIGLSKPNAAELFAEVGELAQNLKKNLEKDQIARDKANNYQANNYVLDNLRKQKKDSVEETVNKVKNHDAEVAKLNFKKMIDDYGGKEALRILIEGNDLKQSTKEPKLVKELSNKSNSQKRF